eukprot:5506045-Pyramimonas_sp.AAC.1
MSSASPSAHEFPRARGWWMGLTRHQGTGSVYPEAEGRGAAAPWRSTRRPRCNSGPLRQQPMPREAC